MEFIEIDKNNLPDKEVLAMTADYQFMRGFLCYDSEFEIIYCENDNCEVLDYVTHYYLMEKIFKGDKQ